MLKRKNNNLIDVIMQPNKALKAEEDSFYNVPDSSASNLLMETLSAGTNIADLPARKRQINHNTKLEVYEDGKRRQIVMSTTKSNVIIELNDIDELAGSNKPAKKLFILSLIKANQQALHNGELTKDYVTFPLSELIDIGFYKTPQSARKGFTSGMNILTSLKLRGQIEHSNKSKSIVETLEVLFTGAKIERGQCTIYLNPRINWGFIAQYFTILPLYYFRLSNRASDLLYYIFYLARQNTKQIEEKGYFNIGLRAIQHRLQLPSEINNTNPYRTIKQPIEECLEELETTHFMFFNNNEFNMLIVADDDAPIKDYLDNGYLKINFTGSFADFFITISKETKFQLKTNERKKARITEKAMIKNLEKKLDN